jgi:hypothetical protein
MTGAELEVWIAEHQDDVPAPWPRPRDCYGLSSVTPHPLGSRAEDCPECPHPCSGGRCPDPAAHAEGAHDL